MYFYESELCCYFKEIISSGHFKFQLPLSWPLVRYSLDATWLLSVLVIDNNFVLVIDNNFRIVKLKKKKTKNTKNLDKSN